MKRLSLLTLLLLSVLMGQAQEPVTVGKGSYAAYAPLAKSKTNEHDGDKSQYMQYRQLYINEQAGVPIPTNDWWTDLINGDRGRSGREVTGHLWSYPQYVQGMTYGLDIHFPTYWVDNGTEMKAQSKLLVKGGNEFNATTPLAEQWSDWTVTFSETSGSKKMTTTLAHGVPFTWIELTNVEPVITAVKTGNDGTDNKLTGTVSVRFTDGAGNTLANGTHTLSQFIISIGSTDAFDATADRYGIYLPTGTEVTIDGSEATLRYSSERQFVVVALLKQPSDLATYATYAYSKPTDTKVSWTYNGSGTLTTNWKVTAEDLRTGAATTDVLQGFIPHHYRRNTNNKANGTLTDLSFFGSNSYLTPRGKLKLVAGNNIDISYKFTGMLPWYPAPHDFAGTQNGHTGQGTIANPFDSEKMLTMLGSYAQTGTFGGDTYWGGKGLTQMALNMAFAREMNDEALFTTCHDRLKEALVNWLTYTPGEDSFFFAYDPRFHGLIGYNTSYDSDTYNDHHFHYGYFTLAAAMLCLVDDDFKQNYGEMVKLIVRDYNNYKRDNWACFLRMMDPWAGHCYAGGMGDGAGNGQESTSESMQGWGGMYLLGVALGDDELRDAGIFGWVSESRATAEYWFDRHGDATIDANYHTEDATDKDDYNIDYGKFKHTKDKVVDYTIPWSSNLTSHGVGWWTWFGGDPVFMQGIQWMPISPALDHLGEDKAFAGWDYDRLMVLKEHKGWDGEGGIGDADLRNSDWGNVVLSYRQWSDADNAAAIFDEGWEKNWGTMKTSSTNGITYFVTHSHRTYGDIDWTVTANYPTARAYNKGGQKYHVAYNPTDAAITVTYSDGTSFEVPARQMKCKELDYTAVTTVFPVDLSKPDIREELVMKNLALGKPCTASSYENEGSKPVGATDGDLNTRWGSAHQDNEWIQVDLGEEANIYKVRVRWEAAYASQYRIELRDTEDGEVTYSITGTGKASDWTELNLGDQAGRYLRLVGVQRGTQYGTSLYEIEVYGQLESAANTGLMGVKITSDKSVLKENEPSQLSITGYRYDKTPMSVTPTWSTTDGIITAAGVFTPNKYGTVSVSATVEGMTATKTLPVEEGLRLTSLTFELSGDAIIGQSVPYTATGKDQFGAPYDAVPQVSLFEVDSNGDLVATTKAVIDTDAKTFTATVAGEYAIKVSVGGLSETIRVRGIGPTGLRYSDIPAVADAPSMSDKLPLFVGQEMPSMNFDYNGASKKGSDHFPVPTLSGGTANALFAYQLGTFGFGELGNLDISDYNMIHADIYVTNDAPAFSFHIEGAPANKVYAKPLTSGRWNSVDLPISNTTLNWLFFSFNDYQAGSNEALVTNVYLYKETSDKIFVGDPDSKGLVTVTTFGSGINDGNKDQFLSDVAALPKTATAIDLSGIELNNTSPMTISTPNNPNVIIILKGDGGDDNAASDQLAKITNTQNVVYNAGGWYLPLKATGYKVVLEDGYPVYPVNFGRCATLTYTRTFAANSYGTMCLPRNVTMPEGLVAYELSSVTDNSIDFNSVASTTAYQPYLVRNTTGAPVTLTISSSAGNVEFARTSAELKTTVGNVDFIGNFQLFRVTGDEGYAAFKSTGQMAWLSNAGTTVGSLRAYLSGVTAAQASKLISLDGVTIDDPGTATAIRQVLLPMDSNQPVYNIHGQMVRGKGSDSSLPKGVYIQNGVKYVVR